MRPSAGILKKLRKQNRNSLTSDSVTVAGPGAVGITVAVALSESGKQVVLAGDPSTQATRKLFSVKNFHGLHAEIPLVPLSSLSSYSDVVLALKAYDLAEAVPFVKGISRRILCLSNGMGFEDVWGSASDKVEYGILTAGFSRISSTETLYSPGELFCLKGGFAEELFSGSRFSLHSVNDMEDTRWAKWYVNSIINPAGALTGLSNNRLRDSELGPVIKRLRKELAVSAPSAEALELAEKMLDELLNNSENMCSMLQDIQSGRKTEIDFLTGLASGYSPAARELTAGIRKLSVAAATGSSC
ncbi:hypothetical protein CSA37_04650 [Candidatus Fermentibacteria bacterium]|nr:MAG: hypothetical protein CSA37_04650 [Candidatus Fermentibacteria bacterium]